MPRTSRTRAATPAAAAPCPTPKAATTDADLAELVKAVREHPGLLAKSTIGLVSDVFGPSDWLTGPGDDGAAVPIAGTFVVACGEALWPPFVKADPFGAGVAAVLANINDLAAMGAVPLGIVDTIAADTGVARRVLEGIRFGCEMFEVPLLGGHLTRHLGEPSVSAFGIGRADHPLSVRNIRVGQRLVVAAALEGDMRGDFPFFRSFGERRDRVAGDVGVLAHVADNGACVAAKDISMAGVVGSLAMLLEHGRFGTTLDLDALPRPTAVPLHLWLTCFPSFGFLLCVPPSREEACLRAFLERGLCAAVVGDIDASGRIALRRGPEAVTVIDLSTDMVTGLRRANPARD
jgi:selenophosphate synthetase-related protein